MLRNPERRRQSSGQSSVPVWVIPFIYAVAAFLLALTAQYIETLAVPHLTAAMSTASALAIYSSVATGMIALTGIAFSLVFMTVQFSASAYSPRLVLWISRDPLIYHTLGLFIATFLYAITALAGVDRRHSGHVPILSVWVVVALLMTSMGFFVVLLKRLGRLEVSHVLRFTADFGRRTVERWYPLLTSATRPVGDYGFRERPVTQELTYSGPPRVLTSLDAEHLVDLVAPAGGVIDVICVVGDTLVEGTPLLRVHGARALLSEPSLLRAFGTSVERTFEQDPKYAIRLLVDIAIRALSPAINDPATAVQALDQIEDLLVRLGRRQLEIGEMHDSSGAIRVVVAVPDWEDFLNLALGEIRCCGADNLQIARRIRALLRDLENAVPPGRHPALEKHRRLLSSAIQRAFPDREDRETASEEDREGLGSTRRVYPLPRRRAG